MKKLSSITKDKMRLAHLGKIFSLEHRHNISKARKGIIFSDKTRQKMSESRRGVPLSKSHITNIKKSLLGRTISEQTRNKIRLSLLGRKRSEDVCVKISLSNRKSLAAARHRGRLHNLLRGRKMPVEQREKRRLSAPHGERCHLWRGGKTPIHIAIRKKSEYKLWREAVYKRDNYTCIFCGQRGGRLNADHIKPFSLYPELRFDLDNGRTLCIPCHKKTDTYGGRVFSHHRKEEGDIGWPEWD